jgi:hypothetical protein
MARLRTYAACAVVGNGTPLAGVPGWVTRVPLEENLGCPGGRNAGLRVLLESADIDVVVELDDDGLLIADDVFARVEQLYAAAPALGIVSVRVANEKGQTLRRHVPRLRAGDPLRRGPVTAFLGGAGTRCRVGYLVRAGPGAAASQDTTGLARGALPADSADHRVLGRHPHAMLAAPADATAHCVADDPPRATARHLDSRSYQAQVGQSFGAAQVWLTSTRSRRATRARPPAPAWPATR